MHRVTISEKSFVDEFKANGGQILGSLRVPLLNPDFAPYLQHIRDINPEAVFLWFPGPSSIAFSREYAERGLHKSGIKLIGTGDVVGDEVLDRIDVSMLGIVTTLQYSVAHQSEKNRAFVEAYRRFSDGNRPSTVAVGVYDGMRLNLRGAQDDERLHEWRRRHRCYERHGLGKSAWSNIDRC